MPRPCPILHTLIDNGQWLHFRCIQCDRAKIISGHEACYTYGHGVTFEELRMIVRGRCRNEACKSQIGVAGQDHVPKLPDGRRYASGTV